MSAILLIQGPPSPENPSGQIRIDSSQYCPECYDPAAFFVVTVESGEWTDPAHQMPAEPDSDDMGMTPPIEEHTEKIEEKDDHASSAKTDKNKKRR